MTSETIENFEDSNGDASNKDDTVVTIITLSLTALTFFLWMFFGHNLPLLKPFTGLTLFLLSIVNFVGLAFQPLGLISSICVLTLIVVLISVKLSRGKKLQSYSLRGSYKSFSE
jgi:hypothetical protein